MSRTKVIAHRGSKGTHPENTIPAFLHAVNVGAEGIELDVQLSKDNELIVIHDEKVGRTTNGRGYVNQLSLKDLKQLDAGSWFAPAYAGTRIPTLLEVLEALKEVSFQGLLNIELKTDRFPYEGIEKKVVDATNSSSWPFSIVFSSFNEETLIRLLELDQTISTALLFKKFGEEKTYLKEGLSLSAWHPKISWIKQASLSTLKEMPIRAWTVNKKADMIHCFVLSLEGIITDFPEKALKVRNRKQKV